MMLSFWFDTNVTGLLLCVTHKEYLNFTTWLYETFAQGINKEIERTGKRTTQLTIVLDFEHFSMRQMASKQGISRNIFQVLVDPLKNSHHYCPQSSGGGNFGYDQKIPSQLPGFFPSSIYHQWYVNCNKSNK